MTRNALILGCALFLAVYPLAWADNAQIEQAYRQQRSDLQIEGLKVGDKLAFAGEYEWSDKGGTLHWTHRDPGGRHAAGWLKHGGRVYQ